MQGNKKAVFATNGATTMAANGAMPMDAPVVATPETAVRNQQSLRPGGGIGDGSANAMAIAMRKMGLIPSEEAPDEEMEDEGEEEMKEGTLDVSDFAAALFEGEDLSDSFKQKCIAVFEAAVNEKVSVVEKAIIEASREIIQEQVASSVESLTEGVDKYLTYVCEQWMQENALAVESGIKTEIVENFIYGLKDLFENSFIDVPDEKYNVIDELFEANSELEAKLNAQINESLTLRNQLVAHQCAEVFVEAATGLADTEVEKLAALAEGIEFDSVEQYAEKIKVLRESYFNGGEPSIPSSGSQILGENYTESKKPSYNRDEMDDYVRTISEQLKLSNTKKVS